MQSEKRQRHIIHFARAVAVVDFIKPDAQAAAGGADAAGMAWQV